MLRSHVRRRPLLAFVVVTFGWSWGLDALVFALDAWSIWWITVPRTWGPLIGALAVTWASEAPFRQWVGRVTTWRVRPQLYLLALLVPIAITNARPVVAWLSGGTLSLAPYPPHLLAVQLLGIMFLAGGLEEFGWRGFLQPRVQERSSALVAGVLIGLLWASWHLPLFLAGLPNYDGDPTSMLYYYSWVVAVSIVLVALTNAAGGSVLPAMLMHASVNQPALVESSGAATGPASLVELLGPGSWWLLAVVLVVAYGAASMSSQPAVTSLSSPGSQRAESTQQRSSKRGLDTPGDE